MTCRNGKCLWVKHSAGAVPFPEREQPRDEASWSYAGVNLEVESFLEKGCMGQPVNPASCPPPKHSAGSGIPCRLLSSDGRGFHMQWKYMH